MRGRVLLVDQYNKVGGGQTVLIDLINSFEQLDFKCTVAVPRGGYIEDNVKCSDFYYLPDLILNNRKKAITDSLKLLFHYLRVWAIIKIIRKTEVVYINGPRYFIFFYICSFFIKRKFIYHIHLDLSNGGKFILKLLNKQKNTHALVFTSGYLLTEYLKYMKKDDVCETAKLHVIEPGLAQRYEALQFKDLFTTNTTSFNFISVGRIYPEKGFDLILEIAKSYTDSKFYIVGDPVDDSIDHYALLKNSAPTNVHFMRSSNNIPGLVNENNIHFGIVPSDLNEAFGIVATELMMCSCIMFVRKRGGMNEISDKTTAIAFEDVVDLKKAIDKVITNSLAAKRALAFKQYSNTKTLYNSQVFTEKLNKLFFGLVTSK